MQSSRPKPGSDAMGNVFRSPRRNPANRKCNLSEKGRKNVRRSRIRDKFPRGVRAFLRTSCERISKNFPGRAATWRILLPPEQTGWRGGKDMILGWWTFIISFRVQESPGPGTADLPPPPQNHYLIPPYFAATSIRERSRMFRDIQNIFRWRSYAKLVLVYDARDDEAVPRGVCSEIASKHFPAA